MPALAILVIAAIIVIVLLRGGQPHSGSQPDRQASQRILPSSSSVIRTLPHKSANHPDIHLPNTSRPAPTNSWMSGLVFSQPSSPVYAYPWTYQTTKNGATLSYPLPHAKADTIFAGHSDDVRVDVGADSARVKSFDDLSALVAYRKSNSTIATSRITEGLPYIFFTIKSGNHAHITLKNGKITQRSDNSYTFTVGKKRYGLYATAKTNIRTGSNTLTVSAKHQPAKFTLITLPKSFDEQTAFAYAGHIITGTKVSYKVKGGASTTTFRLQTAGGKPTLFGLLPRQYQHMSQLSSHSSIKTLLGKQRFAVGKHFSYTLNDPHLPSGKIITSRLPSKETKKLKSLLKQDAASLQFDKTDSYFAGKQLYRAANLLELAHELHMPEQATHIKKALKAQLAMWLDPNGYKHRSDKYFYYDPQIHGVVGVKPSFGSEHFNDHHFHYGYFIYAASVLGRYDQSFVKHHKAMVNVLLKDIASPRVSRYFPKLRTYDSYVGHSWADGYGLKADGNDQESSSEAVNAWYATYLWGKTIHNQRLQKLGQWLYQNEASSALHDWTNINTDAPRFHGYHHAIVSLVWGGKLDYATFFSDQPSAHLGIQLIPMSPGQAYLGADPARIQRNLSAVRHAPGSTPHDQFQDYLLMYQALGNPDKAKASVSDITPDKIDGADSLTYVYAWVYSHANRSQ